MALSTASVAIFRIIKHTDDLTVLVSQILQVVTSQENVPETYFMNKSGYLKISTQTSFNFAHEEHEGSLELSTVVSTIVEDDILLWKTSQSAIISLCTAWCSAILTRDRWNLGMRKSITSTPVSRVWGPRIIHPLQGFSRASILLLWWPKNKSIDQDVLLTIVIIMNVSYVYINLKLYHVVSAL